MSFAFTPENQKKFEALLTKYPTKMAALLPTLWLAQNQNGHLSLEVQEHVASLLDLSPVHVHGVVTFYTMYKQKPSGKFHLQFCKTLSCGLCGSEDLIRHMKEKYKLEHGKVSEDGKFSMELVECLASCGTAPAMAVNEKYVEQLTVEKIDELMKKLSVA
ncbi:MAG: NAD(P)H-dependent oxidoreductase subunit E [Deltaproteobacteria bacterium]|nr:NAD(P)H-dependent oxidoreductase subunit E [Deltaproteobacteria bacterium]